MVIPLLLLSLLGDDSTSYGKAVFEQMRAANSEVRTLVFEFKAVDQASAKVSGTGKPEVTHTSGRVWFQEPNRLRIECNERGNSLTITADHAATRRLTVDRDSGSMTGMIHEGGSSAYSVVASLGYLVPRAGYDFLANDNRAFENVTAQASGKLIRLTGKRNNHQFECDIDPDRGFCLVRQNLVTHRSIGSLRSQASVELHEPMTGIWVPSGAKCDVYDKSELSHQMTIEMVPGSCKINESLPKELFELEFPAGTQVTDGNQRKQYVAGGGTSQSRQKVARLAEEANRLGIAAPTPPGDIVPQPGALSAARPRSSRMFWIVGCAILFAGACSFFVIRRRRQIL